jgi:phenylacetate-coenzyme A ligase PaaK-like adenylate-forming protein
MERVAQPLVRFVLGDLVQVDRQAPSRFTTVAPLVSMEGRVHDAVLRPDGGLVTAGAIDRALALLDGIASFQVNQRKPDSVEVDIVAEEGARASLLGDARRSLSFLFSGLEVAVRTVTAIAAEPSGKYRLARRHFPLDLGSFFPECEGVSL